MITEDSVPSQNLLIGTLMIEKHSLHALLQRKGFSAMWCLQLVSKSPQRCQVEVTCFGLPQFIKGLGGDGSAGLAESLIMSFFGGANITY